MDSVSCNLHPLDGQDLNMIALGKMAMGRESSGVVSVSAML